jgi:RHS repeat-associated protein
VYGNNTGEPCYNATFANAWCWQAYRWNLDYVVDTRGNSMTYFYAKSWSYVGLNNNTNIRPYDYDAKLDHIDYGTRAGSEGAQTAPMQVWFTRSGRCINTCQPNTTDYPDTPWDLYCPTSGSCPNLTTPAFWTQYKLSNVYTRVWDAGLAAYRKVDQWDFTYTYPASGDNISPAGNDTSPNLWLQTLTHTGYAADGVTTLAEPTMTFGGTGMFNRVDWGNAIGVAPFTHYRLTSVVNGAGGQTVVSYSAQECTTTFTPEVESNPYRCFPEFFKPTQAPAGWGWFHKYVVTGVTEKDLTGGSPDEVWSYAYSTANSSDPSLWRHDYTETSQLAYRSWSLWQGYSTVTTTHGAAGGPQTVSTGIYYRGLDGDGQASTDNSAMVWNTRRASVTVPVSTAGVASISGSGGMCLNPAGGGTANGTNIEMNVCSGAASQVFRFVWNGVNANGTMVNPNSGKCVDIQGAGTAAGTNVELYTCNGGANQVWARQPDGSYLNPVSGRCLDTTGAYTAAGTNVDLWDCIGRPNQMFRALNTGAYQIPQARRCVDIAGSVYTDGTNIQDYICNPGAANQQWQLRADGSLVNPFSSKCLTVPGNGTANGTWTQLFPCTGAVGQVWVAQPDGHLLNPNSGRCLDGGAGPTYYVHITISDCNTNPQQIWVDNLVDSEGLMGFTRESQQLDAGTLVSSGIHIPTLTQTGARNAAITPGSGSSAGGQVFAALMVTETSTLARTWLPASLTWRWTQTNTAYNSYALPTTVAALNDTSTATDDVCTTISYVTPDTTKWLVDFPSQTVTTDCAATPADGDYLGGSQTYFDGSTTNGATPTVGLPTKTMALAAVTGGVQTWKQTARAGYDTNGRVTSAYDALDRLTSTAYTPASAGPVTSVTTTNPLLWTSTTSLDPGKGTVGSIVDANGKTTTAQYDPLGRTSSVWLHNRLTSATPDQQYTYTLSAAAPNWVQTQTLGPTGAQISSYTIFDGRLRARQSQTPTPVANGGRMITDSAYDSRGLLAKKSAFYNNASAPTSTLATFADTAVPTQDRYTYDNLGRQTVDAFYSLGTQQWQTTTTYQNDRTAVTPPAGGITTQKIFDARGNTVELRQFTSTNLAGTYQSTTYGYDRLSHRTQAADAAGNAWTWTFDLRGRVVSSTDPDRGTTTSTYDDAAQLLSATDARPVTLSFAYDNLGRATELWQGAVTTGTKLAGYSYDSLAKGQLTSSTRYDTGNAYTTSTTGYDDAYRPLGTTVAFPAVEGTLSTQGPWTTSQTYNVDGSLATASLPAGGGLTAETLTYGYDANGFALTSTGTQAYISSASYYPWGDAYQRLLGVSGSRVRLTTAVDEATRRLTGNGVDTEHPGMAGVFDEVRTDTYGYTPAGTVTSLAETLTGTTVSNQCFTYDFLQRLTEAWTTTAAACQPAPSQATVGGPDPYWSSYSYDTVGDRTGLVQHNAGGDSTTTYTYPTAGGAHPHALSGTSTTPGTATSSYLYDAIGNTRSQTTPTNAQTLVWDSQGHLASTTDSGQTTTYLYDASGTRLLRRDPDGTVTAYLGSEELRKDPAGVITATRYYDSIASRTPAGLTWLATDHHNTAQIAVAAATLAITTRRFQPFGEPRGTPPIWGNTRGFLSGTSDPTGLTHLGVREYDPAIGRFISVDPLMRLSDPQQWEGYVYAGNDPATTSDPTGLIQPNPGVEYGGGSLAAGWYQNFWEFASGAWVPCGAGYDSCGFDPTKPVPESCNGVCANWVLTKGNCHCMVDSSWVPAGGGALGWHDAGGGMHMPSGMRGVRGGDGARSAGEEGARSAGEAAKPAEPAKSFEVPKGERPGEARQAEGADRAESKNSDASKRGCSFDPRTPVLLANGRTKQIGDVKAGDLVLATDPYSGATGSHVVTATHTNLDTNLIDLTVVRHGERAVLHTTAAHRVWRFGHGWTPVGDLEPNDMLYASDASVVLVAKVLPVGGSGLMDDLTVADVHTYYVIAGATPVLVHNDGNGQTPDQMLRSINSLEARIAEHQAKLDAYRADPWAYDNQGRLARAPNDQVRSRIIEGRINHLENEIQGFRNQVENLRAQVGGEMC